MREARRVDHAVADHEQVLARAFADRAIRRQADAFGEAQALGLHADQLARKIVAARPWPCAGSVLGATRCQDETQTSTPCGLALGAQVLAPFPGGDGHVDRRIDLRRDADLAVAAEGDRAEVGAVGQPVGRDHLAAGGVDLLPA